MRYYVLLLAALTAGCGSQVVHRAAADLRTLNVEEPPPPAMVAPAAADRGEGVGQSATAAAPQIAYSYSLGYRLDRDQVPSVQQRHVALCDRLGAARCRIASMSRDAGDDTVSDAALVLIVEARLARAIEDRLDAAVAGAGGSMSSRGVEAEDLSKKIVDTAAKVRGKEALSQRLLALIQKRDGKVGELVEAERAYAQAQEELDSARSWLAELRGRVAMSKVEIHYQGSAPAVSSAWRPLRDAFGSAGEVLGASVARLVTVALAVMPWALVLALMVWLMRRRGWRLRLPRLRRAPAA
ncbi:MAG TPA: DUF4349 domain-containing protein [Allosphingosinicella sp.]|jgi:hypothetical protein